MLAHAFPVVAAGTERTRQSLPSWLIELTCNEVQHLLATLHTRSAGELGHRLRWSVWRRRHQARVPYLPLPPTSRPAAMKITIYGWSIEDCNKQHAGVNL
jgi:hypothetical protein